MSKFLDRISEFLAHRKGLLPIVGMMLIGINFLIQFILAGSFLATSNLFLHAGLLIAVLGLMLYWAL